MKNKKSLGQNWLKDRDTIETIADLAANCTEEPLDEKLSLCVEIGPGLGTLTSSLLRRFNRVIAIEYDERLATNLPKSFPGKNLQVINKDFLQFDLKSIQKPFVVAGNIPYYITTPIIEKLLTSSNKPERIVLLVQKEVADKICPVESKLHNSSLSLFVENFATAHLGPIVTKELFIPPPKVDSRTIVLIPHKQPITKPEDRVLEFIQSSFSNPRKKLSANLAHLTDLTKAELETILTANNIDPNCRPADLDLEQYAMLAKTLRKR